VVVRPVGGRHDQLGEHPAERLLARPAEHALGSLVPVDDVAGLVDGDDGIVGGGDQRFEPLGGVVAAALGVGAAVDLGPQLRGGVEVPGQVAQQVRDLRPAIRAGRRQRALLQARRALRPAGDRQRHAVLLGVALGRQPAARAAQALDVVGVHARQQHVGAGAQHAGRSAVLALEGRIGEHHAAIGDVPDPQRVVQGIRHGGEPGHDGSGGGRVHGTSIAVDGWAGTRRDAPQRQPPCRLSIDGRPRWGCKPRDNP
jgi:hypothetical protein